MACLNVFLALQFCLIPSVPLASLSPSLSLACWNRSSLPFLSSSSFLFCHLGNSLLLTLQSFIWKLIILVCFPVRFGSLLHCIFFNISKSFLNLPTIICPFVSLVYLSNFFLGLLLCLSFLCHLLLVHSLDSSYYTFTRRWKHWYQQVLEFLLGFLNLHFDTSHARSSAW